MEATPANQKQTWRSVLKEITDPFVDLIKSPRVIWGVNLAYTIEGLCYFGVLTYLAMYFSDFVFQGVDHADVWSHQMVMILTAGIALSMTVLGFVPDKIGVRWGLLLSFLLILTGRVLVAIAPGVLGFVPNGLWSALHITTMGGIVFVLVGYGLYQPAAYAAIRQFTTPKTAPMAYAMLYALMNAGSSLAMFSFIVRDDKFLGLGIIGSFWIYMALTVVSLLVTVTFLSKKAVKSAIEKAKAQTDAINAADKKAEDTVTTSQATQINKQASVPVTMWITLVGILTGIYFRVPMPYTYYVGGLVVLLPVVIALLPSQTRQNVVRWISGHPLADTKFFFFIFALIPVQTLFTYNWLILPQYIERAYTGWIGEYFEVFSNVNPVLIFILVPVITALTVKRKTYNMMIWGTLVMGSSAFILALGATPATLCAYILMMTIGEAMWSARLLQYATEIAPEGRAGQYQGVAQLPWFLTKFLVPLLYSGWMLERYCPTNATPEQLNTQPMWFYFGLIAMISPVLLIVAKNWIGNLEDNKKV